MATAALVDSQKTNALSKEKRKKSAKNVGKVEVQDILSKCQEKSLDRVFEVDLHACKLSKIEKCQSFPKLRILDVSCNEIKLIRGLEKNPELKELKLYSNRISKIEGLDKLKDLCSLHLQDNNISRINNGLQKLKKLKMLRLDGNQMQTITIAELAACSMLTYLNISHNGIEDISFLNCLPHLEEFYASHNNLKRVPDLGRCKKLQELDLSYNKISNISGLSSLAAVTIIQLEHNNIKSSDISNILKTVEEFYLKNNQIQNIKKIPSHFPVLEVLDVSCNVIDNFDEVCCALQGSSTLRELSIADNPCTTTSLSHQKLVRTLPQLEVLDGVAIKRPQTLQGRPRPVMRPVSASQMLSTKQLEEQVSMATKEQESFESLISSKFDIVYDLLKKLPEKGKEDKDSAHEVGSSTQESASSPRPVSRCGNRARIQDAKAFAEQHFDKE